jgi:transposase InsO family protein
MTACLRSQDYEVNHKRVARLLRQMGLMAIYPGPRLSQPGEQNVRYAYVLRGMSIDRVNQVWSTDITYIRMPRGFWVSGSHHRLVQSLCARLANFHHVGNRVLSRSARAGI